MCVYTNMLLIRKNQNVLGFKIRKHEKKITSKAVTEVKNDRVYPIIELGLRIMYFFLTQKKQLYTLSMAWLLLTRENT